MELFESALHLSARVSPQAGRQAGAALAMLQRDGLEVLEEALDPGTEVFLGASTAHWDELRSALRGLPRDIASRYGETGLAFVLGWVKRFAGMSRGLGRVSETLEIPPELRKGHGVGSDRRKSTTGRRPTP